MAWLVVDKVHGQIGGQHYTHEAAELWVNELADEVGEDMFLPRAQRVLRLATAKSEARLEEKTRSEATCFVYGAIAVVVARPITFSLPRHV
jgi:hypothetical protein